ncbi:MAG: hypothetical protein LBF72_02535 [Holosporales bacterium]|nr:hypothetical protein [Holosporales bacterium]
MINNTLSQKGCGFVASMLECSRTISTLRFCALRRLPTALFVTGLPAAKRLWVRCFEARMLTYNKYAALLRFEAPAHNSFYDRVAGGKKVVGSLLRFRTWTTSVQIVWFKW